MSANAKGNKPLDDLDKNGDGQITKKEFQQIDPNSKDFNNMDKNHDGILDKKEVAANEKKLKELEKELEKTKFEKHKAEVDLKEEKEKEEGLKKKKERPRPPALTCWEKCLIFRMVLDKSVTAFYVLGTLTCGAYIFVAIHLFTKAMSFSDFGDTAFFCINAIVLGYMSVLQLFVSFWEGVLDKDVNDFKCWDASLIFGMMQFEFGRALFYIGAAFYIYPAARLGCFALDSNDFMKDFSMAISIISGITGAFLLIFDVALHGCVEGSSGQYSKFRKTRNAALKELEKKEKETE